MTRKLSLLSIPALYPVALAEGEGMGTAYEYFAKRLILANWLAQIEPPQNILIAGLPERYGTSLDLLLLANDLKAGVTVVDERPSALAKLEEARKQLQERMLLPHVSMRCLPVNDIAMMEEVSNHFDLAVASEVWQRIALDKRPLYGQRLGQLASHVAVFCPNADNTAHHRHSGLGGLQLEEMTAYLPQDGHRQAAAGYIDIPPFPPGITRSAEQRQAALHNLLETLAMWGLGYYARLERYFPIAIRRSRAHIIYALLD